MTEIKLLPCPFCGGEAELKQNVDYHTNDPLEAGWYAICPPCDLIRDQGWSVRREEAIAAWNTRHREQAEAGEAVPVGDVVAIPRRVYDFLNGTDHLDGYFFGDRRPDERGGFWWRKYMQAHPADKVETETPISLIERFSNFLADDRLRAAKDMRDIIGGEDETDEATVRWRARQDVLALMGKSQGEGDREG